MSTNDWGKNDVFFLSLIRHELYRVTRDGRIFSTRTNRWISEGKSSHKRYLEIEAYDKKQKRFRYITKHRLVYLAKKGPIPKGYTINHEDGMKSNCRPSNLVAAPHAYNIQHSYRTGLQIPMKGNDRWNTKLTDKEVKKIRKAYKTAKTKVKLGGHVIGNNSTHGLARQYDVSVALISAIIGNRRRRNK